MSGEIFCHTSKNAVCVFVKNSRYFHKTYYFTSIQSHGKKLYFHIYGRYIDIVDTGFSYERELIVCSFLQDFSKRKGSSSTYSAMHILRFCFVQQYWKACLIYTAMILGIHSYEKCFVNYANTTERLLATWCVKTNKQTKAKNKQTNTNKNKNKQTNKQKQNKKQ